MPVDDITDARFFADKEIRKLVDEINREFKRMELDSPFKDIDVSNGKALNKEVKEILTNAKELEKVINQIRANGAHIRDNTRKEKEIPIIDNRINDLTNNINTLSKTFTDFQKAIENTTNNIRFNIHEIQSEDFQSDTGYSSPTLEVNEKDIFKIDEKTGKETEQLIGTKIEETLNQSSIGKELGSEIGSQLIEELNGVHGQNIFDKDVFNIVNSSLSRHGVDVDRIIAQGLGLEPKADVDELVQRAIFSSLLKKIGGGRGDLTHEQFVRGSNFINAGNIFDLTENEIKEAITNGDIIPLSDDYFEGVRKGKRVKRLTKSYNMTEHYPLKKYSDRKGVPTSTLSSDDIPTTDLFYGNDSIMMFPDEFNTFEGQGFLAQMESIAKSYTMIVEALRNAGVELENPFEGWDMGDDVSAFSKNVDILYDLFEEKKIDNILNQMNRWKDALPRKVLGSEEWSGELSRVRTVEDITGKDLYLKDEKLTGNSPRDYKKVNNPDKINQFDNVINGLITMREIFNASSYNSLVFENGKTAGDVARAFEEYKKNDAKTILTEEDVKEILEELFGDDRAGIAKSPFQIENLDKVDIKGTLSRKLRENGISPDGTVTVPGGQSFQMLQNEMKSWEDEIINELGEVISSIIDDEFDKVSSEYVDTIDILISKGGKRRKLSDELLARLYAKKQQISDKEIDYSGSSRSISSQQDISGEYDYGMYIDAFEWQKGGTIDAGDIGSNRDQWKTHVGKDNAPDQDREIYKPNEPKEGSNRLVDANGLPITTLNGKEIIIADESEVSSFKEDFWKEDFFGVDDSVNGGGEDAEEFWRQQWDNLQKIGEVLGISKIHDILSQINERIYAFQVVALTAYNNLQKGIENTKIDANIEGATLELGEGTNVKMVGARVQILYDKGAFEGAHVFERGSNVRFEAPNWMFDDAGKPKFVVNKTYDKTRPSYNEDGEWVKYEERVEELKKLLESPNEEIRNFAENALREAISMRDNGFMDRIRNQDLIKGVYGGELPDMANFSFEDYEEVREKYNELKEQWNNTSHYTRDELFEEIGKTEKELADVRKIDEKGRDLVKERELVEKLSNLHSNIGKEFLPKDELVYLELRMKAYEALSSGRIPYQNYGKKLKDLLSAIRKGEGGKARIIQSQIVKIEADLKSMGVDVSETVESTLMYVNYALHDASEELKKAKSTTHKKDIERAIRRLNAFKKHLEQFVTEKEWIPANEYEEELYRSRRDPSKQDLYTRAYTHARERKEIYADGNAQALAQLFGLEKLTIPDLRPHSIIPVGDVLADANLVGKAIEDLVEQREKMLKRFEISTKYGNNESIKKTESDLRALDDTIKTLYPDDSRDITLNINQIKQTNGLIEDTSKQTTKATANFSQFSQNFERATRHIGGANDALVKFFSIVGSGNVVQDMITASSLRQTNEIMLTARRGAEEAENLYNHIQMLVVKLPGNDTFLTNILTMLGTMDKSLTASDLEYMGGVIADYYMGAQAKGQFNNETERELRNYLMTGQTRNLTNSIIASEIESLKGLNSVKERTIALEKALQKTGMDSIAHYDSYTNTLEEFKGRFQKSFADWGDLYLGLLQMGMKIFNRLDDITGSFLSQVTIGFGVVIMGFLSLISIMGIGMSMADHFLRSWKSLSNFIMNELEPGTDKYTQKIWESTRAIAVKVGLINLESESEVANAVATDANTVSEEVNTWGKIKNTIETALETLTRTVNTWAILRETDAMALESVIEKGGIELKILARIALLRLTIQTMLHTIATWIESGTLKENTKAQWDNIKSKIVAKWEGLKATLAKWADVIATNAQTIATWLLEGATWALNGAFFVLELLLNPVVIAILALIFVVYEVGKAFGWWGNIIEVFQAIWAGLHRIWDAFWNNEHIQYTMYIVQGFFENLMAWFGRFGVLGGLWEMVFGTEQGEWDIVADIINVLGAIGEVLWQLSSMDEILEVLRSVGALMGWIMRQWNAFVDTQEYQELIDGFREVRVAIGEVWADLSEVFGELAQAWAELWGEESPEKLKEDGNELLELFKAIAHFIRDVTIPLLKLIVPLIRATLLPIVTVAKVVTKIIESVKWVLDHVPSWMIGSTEQKGEVALSNGKIYQAQQDNYAKIYAKGKNLAKNYVNTNSNSTIINNNFSEGSVQADARNMTKKEVRQMFTSAFGYNQARGVNGIVR